MIRKALVLIVILSLVSGTALLAAGAEEDRPMVGFMSNGPYEFWIYAAAGAEQASQDYNVDVEFFMPPGGLPEEQQRFMEAMIARGTAGFAMSVADPDNLTPFLQEVIHQEGVPIVTLDSDAPRSDRTAFVGMSNYATGREAGEHIRELLPDGGNFVISVGRLDAQNAIERRQGIIDELNGEPYSFAYPEDAEMTPDEPNISIGPNGEWTLIDTIVDVGDPVRAKSNAEDAILRHGDDLDLMIGLWAYSTPAIISAAEDTDSLGDFHIVAFDFEPEVLRGIEEGYVYASMSQDPFMYAYESIKILAQMAHGETPDIPDDLWVRVDAPVINQQNLAEMRSMYESQLEDGQQFLEDLGVDVDVQ